GSSEAIVAGSSSGRLGAADGGETVKRLATASQNVLMPPQPYEQQSSLTGTPNRRRSIKRQKSQDMGDEEGRMQATTPKPPPSPAKAAIYAMVKKQSSDESQTSSLTDNSTSSNSPLK